MDNYSETETPTTLTYSALNVSYTQTTSGTTIWEHACGFELSASAEFGLEIPFVWGWVCVNYSFSILQWEIRNIKHGARHINCGELKDCGLPAQDEVHPKDGRLQAGRLQHPFHRPR